MFPEPAETTESPERRRPLISQAQRRIGGTMRSRKQAALQRLARLEGQVRGVARMIEDDRHCVDILNRTLAIRSALGQVELLILQDHADECVEEAIASGDADAQREKFRELVGVFEKVCR